MSGLDILLERIRAVLLDSDLNHWADAELTEAVRQALGDLVQVCGRKLVLNGLDGETAPTDLPGEWLSLLARGAAGYALMGRAAGQVDAFQFEPGLPAAALQAAQAQIQRFELGLRRIAALRERDLQQSADAPFPTPADELPGGWALED